MKTAIQKITEGMQDIQLAYPNGQFPEALRKELSDILQGIGSMLSHESAYDPNFGDDKKCGCGHAYYRHFDTYENMEPVGCKYCPCDKFRAKHLVGSGVFLWDRGERVSGRWGSFYLTDLDCVGSKLIARYDWKRDNLLPFQGKNVHVICRVTEARQSSHVFNINKRPPPVGTEFYLGAGTLGIGESALGQATLVLEPSDGRKDCWMDPEVLYQLHEQTVEVFVEETP